MPKSPRFRTRSSTNEWMRARFGACMCLGEDPMAKRRRAFGRIVKWKGRWCARWIDENGVLRQKSFRGSKALAQRFLAQKLLEMEEREAAGERAIVRIKFADLFESLWEMSPAPPGGKRE